MVTSPGLFSLVTCGTSVDWSELCDSSEILCDRFEIAPQLCPRNEKKMSQPRRACSTARDADLGIIDMAISSFRRGLTTFDKGVSARAMP
jgi:hypothetical protein